MSFKKKSKLAILMAATTALVVTLINDKKRKGFLNKED